MSEDKQKWLKQRLNGIGGSEAAIVMGVSPYKSRLELWNDKVNKQIVEIDNPDLKWGRLLEPVIADEYERLTGRTLTIHKEIIWSKMYPFMFANVDRFILDEKQSTPVKVLEIKTKSAFSDWNDEIPLHYKMQLQHYLAVTGLSKGVFAVLDMGKKDLIIKEFDRDEELIKTLIEEESKFWNLVQNKITPEVTGDKSCSEFLKNKYSKGKESKTIDLRDNEDATFWASTLKPIKEDLKRLKKEKLECDNNLMSIMQDAEVGLGDNYKITWKSPVDNLTFDMEKFKKVHPKLYDEFVNLEPQSRRFVVRFNKEE